MEVLYLRARWLLILQPRRVSRVRISRVSGVKTCTESRGVSVERVRTAIMMVECQIRVVGVVLA